MMVIKHEGQLHQWTMSCGHTPCGLQVDRASVVLAEQADIRSMGICELCEVAEVRIEDVALGK